MTVTYRQELIARIVQGMMAYYGPLGFHHEEAEKDACTIADHVMAREQKTRPTPTTAAEVAKDTSSVETRFDVLLKRLDAFHPRLNRQDADLGEILDRLEATDRRLDTMEGHLALMEKRTHRILKKLEKNDQ